FPSEMKACPTYPGPKLMLALAAPWLVASASLASPSPGHQETAPCGSGAHGRQIPWAHTAPWPQATARLPPLAGSRPRSTSQPFTGSPSQSPNPALQATPQAPLTHLPTALGAIAAQALPQAPQLARSLASCASQPLAGLPSQSVKPWAQPPLVHI